MIWIARARLDAKLLTVSPCVVRNITETSPKERRNMPSYITQRTLELEALAEIENVTADELAYVATDCPWDLVRAEAEILATDCDDED